MSHSTECRCTACCSNLANDHRVHHWTEINKWTANNPDMIGCGHPMCPDGKPSKPTSKVGASFAKDIERMCAATKEHIEASMKEFTDYIDKMDSGLRHAIPMILSCPECHARHIDRGTFATKLHHTHACQHCGMVWRPAIVATVGVQFLPGFKDEQ